MAVDIIAQPTIKPFVVRDSNGKILFRTALSLAERTGKTTEQQEAMVLEAYQGHLAAIEAAQNAPQDPAPSEEG